MGKRLQFVLRDATIARENQSYGYDFVDANTEELMCSLSLEVVAEMFGTRKERRSFEKQVRHLEFEDIVKALQALGEEQLFVDPVDRHIDLESSIPEDGDRDVMLQSARHFRQGLRYASSKTGQVSRATVVPVLTSLDVTVGFKSQKTDDQLNELGSSLLSNLDESLRSVEIERDKSELEQDCLCGVRVSIHVNFSEEGDGFGDGFSTLSDLEEQDEFPIALMSRLHKIEKSMKTHDGYVNGGYYECVEQGSDMAILIQSGEIFSHQNDH